MANTIAIDEDNLKKIKFALVFMAGDYGHVIKALALSKDKKKKQAAYRLESLRLAAYEIIERYSADVDLEAIINSDKVDWATVKGLIK